MKRQTRILLRSYFLDLLVYAALVAGYYLIVLHFMGDSLLHIFESKRRLYAALALALIIGQGLLLEVLTRVLLGWIAPRTEDG